MCFGETLELAANLVSAVSMRRMEIPERSIRSELAKVTLVVAELPQPIRDYDDRSNEWCGRRASQNTHQFARTEVGILAISRLQLLCEFIQGRGGTDDIRSGKFLEKAAGDIANQ